MAKKHSLPLLRVGLVFVVLAGLAACTAGGQFDPTEAVSADIFNTKKKISGDREPLFPQGVPGAETGVPPDLVKGYQPPPEAPALAASEPPATGKATAAQNPAKPKPKPKVARAPTTTPQAAHDPAFDQKPASPVQSSWPASPAGQMPQQPQPPQQSAQSPWPAPARPSQPPPTAWPDPSQLGKPQAAPPAQGQ
jgi:hypothetical protein